MTEEANEGSLGILKRFAQHRPNLIYGLVHQSDRCNKIIATIDTPPFLGGAVRCPVCHMLLDRVVIAVKNDGSFIVGEAA